MSVLRRKCVGGQNRRTLPPGIIRIRRTTDAMRQGTLEDERATSGFRENDVGNDAMKRILVEVAMAPDAQDGSRRASRGPGAELRRRRRTAMGPSAQMRGESQAYRHSSSFFESCLTSIRPGHRRLGIEVARETRTQDSGGPAVMEPNVSSSVDRRLCVATFRWLCPLRKSRGDYCS